MRRLKGLIQLAIALALVALIVWTNIIPDEGRRLEDSIYVEDAQVLAENEGKRVIIAGRVEAVSPATDADLGITFDSLSVRRVVERLHYLDGWKWQSVEDYDTTSSLKKASFAGSARIGEFTLDAELVKRLVGYERDWEEGDLDADTFARLEQDWRFFLDGGQLYMTQAPSFAMDWEYPLYSDLEGSLRVRYRLWGPGETDEATVVGIQRGTTLEYDPELNAGSTFEGILSADEVVESNNFAVTMGLIVFAGIPAALLIFFGVRNVLDR